MPKMTICSLNGRTIEVEDALDLRKATRARLDFRCIGCGEAVRPHKSSGHGVAHFEHRVRNPDCPPKAQPARQQPLAHEPASHVVPRRHSRTRLLALRMAHPLRGTAVLLHWPHRRQFVSMRGIALLAPRPASRSPGKCEGQHFAQAYPYAKARSARMHIRVARVRPPVSRAVHPGAASGIQGSDRAAGNFACTDASVSRPARGRNAWRVGLA